MIELSSGTWINKPNQSAQTHDSVSITTDSKTDFWQRSYYGFRADNAPAYLLSVADNFTFTARVSFSYNALYDQCGLIIYLDKNNWFKASIEYENQEFSRLGSVVTNLGHSDWATTDIPLPDHIWYRLSRRGPDFLIESSFNGESFKQMRIFHLHSLGETTELMGKSNPPLAAANSVNVGVYACSPSESSFTANFSDIVFEPCQWESPSA